MADKIETMDRRVLAKVVRREIGMSHAEAGRAVDQVLGFMCEALWQGEDVKITGFGTFKLLDKGARVGRNPMTGELHSIEPRRVATFSPSGKLRDRLR